MTKDTTMLYWPLQLGQGPQTTPSPQHELTRDPRLAEILSSRSIGGSSGLY